MSINATVHFTNEQLAIVVGCLEEVRIADRKEAQSELFVRLSRLLEKRDPQAYDMLAERGFVTHWRDHLAEQMTPEQRQAIVREHIAAAQ